MMIGLLFSLLCQQALKRQGRPSGLIGQYKPYLNSNDSPTRDILKDYSGQGHDIQLYNFGYALGSGYGSWKEDYNDRHWLIRVSITATKSYNKIIITKVASVTYLNFYYQTTISEASKTIPSYKIKVTGLTEGQTIYYAHKETNNAEFEKLITIDKDGIYTLPSFEFAGEGNKYGFNFGQAQESCNITIEQITDYPGALVSDGVDDYGLCENFPILTKEKGYTVCAIRKWIDTTKTSAIISKRNSTSFNDGAFVIERTNSSTVTAYSFGSGIDISNKFNNEDVFIHQTSKKYNNQNMTIGERIDTDKIYLFSSNRGVSEFASTALYALEIYDHDLTDEEIQSVKEAMYNEYLTATNTLQNHIIADYECYDKTNEDEDRDVLKDLSGNGHDIQLYNFGFAEGSGYGKYAQNFNDWINNNSANIIMSKSYNKVRLDINSSEIGAYVAYITKINYNNASTYKVFCKSDLQDVKLEFGYNTGNQIELNINGITEIPMQTESSELYIVNSNRQVGYIELEIIPEYQGALVSDGVDDYGLCENFPILNKEDGYTILTIRKHITFPFAANTGFISKRDMRISIDIGTVFEKWGNASTPESTCSFGLGTAVDIDNEKLFSYQTSNIYNGQSILVGSQEDNPCLILFGSTINESGKVVGFSNSALYAFKILNKDCTTEEIKFIAKQMVAKHKEKTGETITLNI